jgi:peroxiredoxin
MIKSILSILAVGGLVAAIGCSQSTPNEPKQLEQLVDREAGQPLPPAKSVADSAPEPKGPVQPAAFADAEEPKPAHSDADADADEPSGPATVPPVELSQQHANLCRVKVGDAMPEVELPKVLGGTARLSALYGKSATVIVFWKGDRQMALDELSDLGPDVVQKFGSRGVEVVGVAVDQPAADARSTIQSTAANFPQLLDADGKAFKKVGSDKLPWTLVLDANGKIVYFDLEYSLATRRELQQALLATVR